MALPKPGRRCMECLVEGCSHVLRGVLSGTLRVGWPGGNGARLTRSATRTDERARGLRSTQAVDGCKQPAKYIQ